MNLLLGYSLVFQGILAEENEKEYRNCATKCLRATYALIPMCDIHENDVDKQICMIKAFTTLHDCTDEACAKDKDPDRSIEKYEGFYQ